MALAEASTLITVPICATGSGTIRLVEEVICARILDGVHFDFDYTFVRPEAKPIIREIVDDVNRDAQRLVLIAGHTDRSGSDAYNEGLSDSRARSVFGYITNNVDVWVDLLHTELNLNGGARVARSGNTQSRDRWGTREAQYMLSYLRSSAGTIYYTGQIDDAHGPGTEAALDAFRADNGIPAGGGGGARTDGIDEDTWRKLFEIYIQVDALIVDPSRFLDPPMIGCGEKFPRLETRPPGTESQDLADANARLEINRRVEFLLIPPSKVPDPLTCENLYANPDSPVVLCADGPQPITVTLHCSTGQDIQNHRADLALNVTMIGGFTNQFTTDASGKVILPDGDTLQGDYRVSAVGNFGLVLRDQSLGQTRGSEVSLHLTASALVELMVVDIPARLNFTELGNPDAILDVLSDPITAAAPVEFMLVADLADIPADLTEITVDLASFLLRGPTTGVPPDQGGTSGSVSPATALEFVDPTDQVIQEAPLNERFRLRLNSGEVSGDEITVMVSSHWIRG